MTGVETMLERDRVWATGVVAASPHDVFEYLRRPANHAELSGDGTVKGTVGGDEVLTAGSKFGMSMRVGLPYRIHSTVVEFEPDQLIAWSHFGGHRWRWELTPVEGGTKVTETFDMTTSKAPPLLRLMGYPKRHRDNVEGSVSEPHRPLRLTAVADRRSVSRRAVGGRDRGTGPRAG